MATIPVTRSYRESLANTPEMRAPAVGAPRIQIGKCGIPRPRPAIQTTYKEEEMMMAKRILVPLDGSESAEVAAALAADLARGSGGGGRLLQVHPVPGQRGGSFGRVVAYADPEMERGAAEGRAYLESVKARVRPVVTEKTERL